MPPEETARLIIDQKLIQAGWIVQNLNQLNLSAAVGNLVRRSSGRPLAEVFRG